MTSPRDRACAALERQGYADAVLIIQTLESAGLRISDANAKHKSRIAAAKAHRALDKKLGRETPSWIIDLAEGNDVGN